MLDDVIQMCFQPRTKSGENRIETPATSGTRAAEPKPQHPAGRNRHHKAGESAALTTPGTPPSLGMVVKVVSKARGRRHFQQLGRFILSVPCGYPPVNPNV